MCRCWQHSKAFVVIVLLRIDCFCFSSAPRLFVWEGLCDVCVLCGCVLDGSTYIAFDSLGGLLILFFEIVCLHIITLDFRDILTSNFQRKRLISAIKADQSALVETVV